MTLRVPAALAGATTGAGAALQIGGWTDALYHKPQWRRLPEVVRQFRLTGRVTRAASASGGLLYLVLPAGLHLGRVRVQVSGGE